jgi:hypothetical protein
MIFPQFDFVDSAILIAILQQEPRFTDWKLWAVIESQILLEGPEFGLSPNGAELCGHSFSSSYLKPKPLPYLALRGSSGSSQTSLEQEW